MLGSPLDSKEIKPVDPKGNQPWIFTGRTDAETPIFWPPVVKNQLIGKDSDAGKVEGRRRRGQQRVRWLDSITDSMDMSLSELWEVVKDREVWCIVAHRVAENQTQLSNWTTKNVMKSFHKNVNRGRFRELPGWWTHPCTERLHLNSPGIELPTLSDIWTWSCVSLHLAGRLYPWSYPLL